MKSLHPYEQSLLLVAMLFERKNLADILNFLQPAQSERMKLAKEKFMALSRNERMTEIILELRRLLLINENRSDLIHNSYIQHALAKEPPYLRSIITQSLSAVSIKPKPTSSLKIFLPLIFNTFLNQLTKSSQKIAIYDPVLMRLQFLKDDAQETIFVNIGRNSIESLSLLLHRERFFNFLKKKGFRRNTPPLLSPINPFKADYLRKHFLQEIIRYQRDGLLELTVFAGLFTTALYLANHKNQWQKAIALGLHFRFGEKIETLINRMKNFNINKDDHALLSKFLFFSFDQIKT